MKMRMLFAVLFLLSAGAAGAACTDADKAALEKFDRDWSVAGSSGDRATLEKIYAKNYADLTPGGARSRADVIDGMVTNAEAAKASGKSEPVPTQDFYEINCTDRSALITHRVWGTDGDGADAKVWQARSIHQLEKIDGRWQVVSNAVHNLSDEWIVGYKDLEWNLADLNADKAWFERNLADDYWGVDSKTGAMENKAAALASVGEGKTTVAVTTDMDVQVDGDNGRVSGIYHTEGTDKDGKMFKRSLRYIDTFVKRDGRWQIWSSQATPIKE